MLAMIGACRRITLRGEKKGGPYNGWNSVSLRAVRSEVIVVLTGNA